MTEAIVQDTAETDGEDLRDLEITRIHDIQRTHHVDVDVHVHDGDIDAWLDAIAERLPMDGRVIRFAETSLVRFYGSRATLDQLHELLRGGMTENEVEAALDEFDDDDSDIVDKQ